MRHPLAEIYRSDPLTDALQKLGAEGDQIAEGANGLAFSNLDGFLYAFDMEGPEGQRLLKISPADGSVVEWFDLDLSDESIVDATATLDGTALITLSNGADTHAVAAAGRCRWTDPPVIP